MKKKMIAGIGELLWDVLPEGEALGGAPMNFAYHVNRLGEKGIPVSTVGDDARGRNALETLRKKEVELRAVSVVEDYPTGYVEAQLNEQGQAEYHFPDDVAWDHLRINAYAQSIQSQLDAICFGTLAQRSEPSAKVIQGYLDSLPEQTLRVYDLNFRQHFYSLPVVQQSLEQAHILKLSDEEMPLLCTLLKIRESGEKALLQLLDRFELQLVIFTRGSQGSVLLSHKTISRHAGIETEVIDTIGAGGLFYSSSGNRFFTGKGVGCDK